MSQQHALTMLVISSLPKFNPYKIVGLNAVQLPLNKSVTSHSHNTSLAFLHFVHPWLNFQSHGFPLCACLYLCPCSLIDTSKHMHHSYIYFSYFPFPFCPIFNSIVQSMNNRHEREQVTFDDHTTHH